MPRPKTESTLAGLLPRVRKRFSEIESALVLPFNPPAIQGVGSRQSLATAVFGGMLFSTVLNLLLIPVLYVLVETARERVTHQVSHRAGDTEEGNGRDPGGSGTVPAK